MKNWLFFIVGFFSVAFTFYFFSSFVNATFPGEPAISLTIYPNFTTENESNLVYWPNTISVSFNIIGDCSDSPYPGYYNVTFFVKPYDSGTWKAVFAGWFTNGTTTLIMPTTDFPIFTDAGIIYTESICNSTMWAEVSNIQYFNVVGYSVGMGGFFITPTTGDYDTSFTFHVNYTNNSWWGYPTPPYNNTIWMDDSVFMTNWITYGNTTFTINHIPDGNHEIFITAFDANGQEGDSPTFNISVLSNPTYKYWFKSKSCTVTSGSNYGSLSCYANFSIPSDCVNITSQAVATTVLIGEDNLNSTSQFSKWACDPASDITGCERDYKVCNYENANTPAIKNYNNYVANQTASAYFLEVMPQGCLIGGGATFKLIGNLYVSCLSPTQSGVYIDESNATCDVGRSCFSSTQQIETLPDCTFIMTNCPYGCENGACSIENPAINTPVTSASNFGKQASSFFLTPIVIWTFIILAISIAGEVVLSRYGVKTNGKAFMVIFIICANLLAMIPLITNSSGAKVPVYPGWLLILEVVLVAGFIAYSINKARGG